MNYNDIIEYIDETFDENFEDAKHWCRDNNAELVELIERREEKLVDEEYQDEEGNIQTHKVKKLFRYFQIVKKVIPEPTPEEKEAQVRATRDAYINSIEWRVNRYRDQVELGLQTDDTEETYMSILAYMQYLRDIPEDPDFPDVEVKTFEEWSVD